MDNNIRKGLELIKIPEAIITTITNTKAIELIEDKEDVFKVRISKDIAYDFYCSEFLDSDRLREVGILDIIYSNEDSDCYVKAYRFAEFHEKRVMRDEFDFLATAHQTALVCYILTKVNDYKYSKYKTVLDVEEPIPFQIYAQLVEKSKEPVEVYIEHNDTIYAGELSQIRLVKGMTGVQVFADINIVSKGLEGYIKEEVSIQIKPKQFVKSLQEIGLNPMNPELKAELKEYGKRYVELTSGPKYCECNGEGYTQGWMSDERHRIDSRVMIDLNSFRLLNPRIDNSWYEGGVCYTKGIVNNNSVKEEELWMCSPVVYGFSFSNKIWCKMYARDMKEIVFSDKAFDELIIPEENKDVFVASLTHDMPSLDSISGKGSGKIFLLYGAPGVGKTMTAESVAEFLQKPLYFVSVGELGVKPEQLEAALDKVMKVANSWDAIILLDEVDVFAVKREGATIERNAMTAIFLRMLERYSGVMFMTTNLLDNLDDAFISRSTAVIKYNDLSTEDRARIWNGMFDKIESLGTIKLSSNLRAHSLDLASHKLNGRVIKNTIRLAYCLALSKNEELSEHHISTALRLRQC